VLIPLAFNHHDEPDCRAPASIGLHFILSPWFSRRRSDPALGGYSRQFRLAVDLLPELRGVVMIAMLW